MANKLDTLYPGRVTPGDADYPGGSIKNETTPGSSNDGTPLDKEWANDKEGFFQALLLEAGITPSEVTDTALLSQYLEAAKQVLSPGGYIEILPFGSYTSSTYTIPGGLTWDDFSLIYAVGSNDDVTSGRVGNTAALTAEAIAANPTSWEILIQTSSGNTATVAYVSSTQFSVTRSTNDSIRQVYGYRK